MGHVHARCARRRTGSDIYVRIRTHAAIGAPRAKEGRWDSPARSALARRCVAKPKYNVPYGTSVCVCVRARVRACVYMCGGACRGMVGHVLISEETALIESKIGSVDTFVLTYLSIVGSMQSDRCGHCLALFINKA